MRSSSLIFDFRYSLDLLERAFSLKDGDEGISSVREQLSSHNEKV
jgi:hypothetical protein